MDFRPYYYSVRLCFASLQRKKAAGAILFQCFWNMFQTYIKDWNTKKPVKSMFFIFQNAVCSNVPIFFYILDRKK